MNFEAPVHVVVMGVSGCGKSTVGALLARSTDAVFADADDFHPEPNISKMSNGIPLTDPDRVPWLTALATWIAEQDRHGRHTVLACSSLKRRYRDTLRTGARGVAFVHLFAEPGILLHRMRGRPGHYMPPALLTSQLDTLEPLSDNEIGLTISSVLPPADIVAAVHAGLDSRHHTEEEARQ